jgi:antitoxin (DNA-binding transcriptional repressor) of toxin-antitoxin stability system
MDFHLHRLYIVHMKRVTASEARRHWFRLLDQVLEGEVVAIVRKGARIIIRREQASPAEAGPRDYSGIIRVPDVDGADRWGWEWEGEDVSFQQDERP